MNNVIFSVNVSYISCIKFCVSGYGAFNIQAIRLSLHHIFNCDENYKWTDR